MDEIELQELDPQKIYVVLVPQKDMGKLAMATFPKNVVAGFPKEMVEFQQLDDLVNRLGYKLVRKDDPRYE